MIRVSANYKWTKRIFTRLEVAARIGIHRQILNSTTNTENAHCGLRGATKSRPIFCVPHPANRHEIYSLAYGRLAGRYDMNHRKLILWRPPNLGVLGMRAPI